MKLLAILALVGFCGVNADKIIGGSSAGTYQFPSIVYQESLGSFFCGGTIISNTYVLSAAHCQKSTTGLTITAGSTSRTSGGTTISVSSATPHPSYNSNTYQNDIMLLRLSNALSYSSRIAAASLISSSPSSGTMCTVAGWGDTNSGIVQNLATNLQYVDVPVVAKYQCNGANSYDGAILNGMICIGYMSGGQDSCQGDSGGPAYIQGTSTLAGVVSWGYGCASTNYPGVYADVAYYRSWINSNSY